MSASLNSYHHPIPGRTDWETPEKLFGPLHEEFGFTLDVCATPENAKCATYFTPEMDGLAQEWGTNVCWMNPPYGRAIREWMAKALAACRGGATVVALVPSRTDSAWWHDVAMRGEIRFLRGRVKFVGAPYFAPFPCAVVVLRSGPRP